MTIKMVAPSPHPSAFHMQFSKNSYTLASDRTIDAQNHDVKELISMGFTFGFTYGTWTPVLSGSSTAGTQTYTTQSGIYCVIGKLIKAQFKIVTTAIGGTIAGNAIITGLPIALPADMLDAPVSLGDISGITLEATYTALMAVAAASGSQIAINEFKSGAASKALPVAQLGSATTLVGSLTYLTD